jgi:hypothetical protein
LLLLLLLLLMQWLLNAADHPVTGSVWRQFAAGIVAIIDLEEVRAVRGGLLQRLIKIFVGRPSFRTTILLSLRLSPEYIDDRIQVDAANLQMEKKDPKKKLQVPVALLGYEKWRSRLTSGFNGITLTGDGGIHPWFTQLIRSRLALLPALVVSPPLDQWLPPPSGVALAPVVGLPLPDPDAFNDEKRAPPHPAPQVGNPIVAAAIPIGFVTPLRLAPPLPVHNNIVPVVAHPQVDLPRAAVLPGFVAPPPAPVVVAVAVASPRSPLANRAQLMHQVTEAGQKELYQIACKVQQATNRPQILTKGKGRSVEVVRRELLEELEKHTMEATAGAA